MQDRFKTRCWHKIYKKIYNVYSITPFGVVISSLAISNKKTNFEDCILMQCTGLKDKNNKLIFEGDVVVNKETDTKGHIEWCPYNGSLMYLVKGMDDYFSLDKIYNDFGETPFEVIGNIYENAELLK